MICPACNKNISWFRAVFKPRNKKVRCPECKGTIVIESKNYFLVTGASYSSMALILLIAKLEDRPFFPFHFLVLLVSFSMVLTAIAIASRSEKLVKDS